MSCLSSPGARAVHVSGQGDVWGGSSHTARPSPQAVRRAVGELRDEVGARTDRESALGPARGPAWQLPRPGAAAAGGAPADGGDAAAAAEQAAGPALPAPERAVHKKYVCMLGTLPSLSCPVS